MSYDDLLGFGDFFSTDSVGFEKAAGPPPAARPASPPKPNKDGVYHGTVLQRGKNVLAKTVNAAVKAKMAASRPPAMLSPVASRAVVNMANVKLGLAPAPKQSAAQQAKAKATAEKAKKAIDKLKKAQATQVKARKVTAQHALNSRGKAKDLAKDLVKQKLLSKTMRTPLKRRTKAMVGCMIGVLEEMCYDPEYSAHAQQTLVGMASCIGEEAYDMPQDLPPEEAPPADDGSLEQALAALDSDTNKLDNPPAATPSPPIELKEYFTKARREALGGIVYDESRGRPDGFAGSQGLFERKTDRYVAMSTGQIDGIEHNGYVWGRYWDDGPEKGIGWGDELKSGQWNKLRGRHKLGVNTIEYDRVDESEVVATNAPGKSPAVGPSAQQGTYGPIVGNPAMADFKNMRMDDTGVFFWVPDEAPPWVLLVLKKVADATAAKEKAAADAQAKADAAANAKAQADREAEKARVDAENAIAEAKAASEAKITEGQQEGQASAVLIQQQQAETAQMSLDTEQQKQAGELLMQQAQQQMQYAQEQEAYGDEGGGEEDYYDSGEAVPGADMMRDEDGEGYQEDQGEF